MIPLHIAFLVTLSTAHASQFRFPQKSTKEHTSENTLQNVSDNETNSIPVIPPEILLLRDRHSIGLFFDIWSHVCQDYPCHKNAQKLSIFAPLDSVMLFSVPQDAPNPFHLDPHFQLNFMKDHISLSTEDSEKKVSLSGVVYNLDSINNDNYPLVNGLQSSYERSGRHSVYIMKNDKLLTSEVIMKAISKLNSTELKSWNTGTAPGVKGKELLNNAPSYLPCGRNIPHLTYQQYLQTNILPKAGLDDVNLSDVTNLTIFIVLDEDLQNLEKHEFPSVNELLPSMILNGSFMTEDFRSTDRLQTLANTTITVTMSEKLIELNGVPILCENITLSNGVLHIVDGVIPPLPDRSESESPNDSNTSGDDSDWNQTELFPVTARGHLDNKMDYDEVTSFLSFDDRGETTRTSNVMETNSDEDGGLAILEGKPGPPALPHGDGINKVSHDTSAQNVEITAESNVHKTTKNEESVVAQRSKNINKPTAPDMRSVLLTGEEQEGPGMVPTSERGNNIKDVLIKALQEKKLTIMSKLFERCNIAWDKGDYTFFTPSDAAFAQVSTNLVNLNSDESIQNILEQHTVPYLLRAEDFRNNQLLKNLKNQSLIVNQYDDGWARWNTVQGVQVYDLDNHITNHLLFHSVRKVLVPGHSTLSDALSFSPHFKYFKQIFKDYRSKLPDTYTILVPSDKAFTDSIDKYASDFLGYHIIPGVWYTSGMVDGDILTSYNNRSVVISQVDGHIQLNKAPLVIQDVPLERGVLHTVDNFIQEYPNTRQDPKRH